MFHGEDERESRTRGRQQGAPPTVVECLVCALSTVLLLDAFSSPGGLFALGWGVYPLSPMLTLIIPLGLLTSVTAWMLRLRRRLRAGQTERAKGVPDGNPCICEGGTNGASRIQKDQPRVHANGVAVLWTWCVAPVCALTLAVAVTNSWLLNSRFELSRRAFESYVNDLVQSPGAASGPQQYDWGLRRIGLYPVRGIRVWGQPRRITFFTGGFIMGSFGFEYRADEDVAEVARWGVQEPWSIMISEK